MFITNNSAKSIAYPTLPSTLCAEFTSSYPDTEALSSNAVVMSGHLKWSWDVLVRALGEWRSRYGALNVVVGPVFDSDGDTLKDNYEQWMCVKIFFKFKFNC